MRQEDWKARQMEKQTRIGIFVQGKVDAAEAAVPEVSPETVLAQEN